VTQTPSRQLWSGEHRLPQAPQLLDSMRMFAGQPASFAHPKPNKQAFTMHVAPEQSGIAFINGHGSQWSTEQP